MDVINEKNKQVESLRRKLNNVKDERAALIERHRIMVKEIALIERHRIMVEERKTKSGTRRRRLSICRLV